MRKTLAQQLRMVKEGEKNKKAKKKFQEFLDSNPGERKKHEMRVALGRKGGLKKSWNKAQQAERQLQINEEARLVITEEKSIGEVDIAYRMAVIELVEKLRIKIRIEKEHIEALNYRAEHPTIYDTEIVASPEVEFYGDEEDEPSLEEQVKRLKENDDFESEDDE